MSTAPGELAYRVTSYAMTHLPNVSLLEVTSARGQLVHGENLWVDARTTKGPMTVTAFVDETTVQLTVACNTVACGGTHHTITTVPTALPPPCVPRDDGCASEVLLPVCANNITFANPCVAKRACRLGLTVGACRQ